MSARTSLSCPPRRPSRPETGAGEGAGCRRARGPSGTSARRAVPVRGRGFLAVPRRAASGRRPDDLFRVPYEIELDPGFDARDDLAHGLDGLPSPGGRGSSRRGWDDLDPNAD